MPRGEQAEYSALRFVAAECLRKVQECLAPGWSAGGPCCEPPLLKNCAQMCLIQPNQEIQRLPADVPTSLHLSQAIQESRITVPTTAAPRNPRQPAEKLPRANG